MPTTYAVPNGATQFAATLWNGGQTSPFSVSNGANNTTGVTFQPDFVWAKERSASSSHRLYDSVRGTGLALFSNSTSAETTETNPGVSAFQSTGFQITNTSGNAPYLNETSQTYVGWQWKAGGTASSNTNGSITSQVSVNATAGFSIVTYTGTGANATVGHGLGVAPSMVIVKKRGAVGDWPVYHIGLTSAAYNLYLDATNAQAIDSPPTFNSTAPTSSVFSLSSNTQVNASGVTAVAYCWAQIPGYSAFGKYTGNGSADGPFVYTGFRPRFVMVKNITSSPWNWFLFDSSRNTYNVTNTALLPNDPGAETTNTTWIFDLLSNGFKNRGTNGNVNNSGDTYIYAAFAENPFKYANAR